MEHKNYKTEQRKTMPERVLKKMDQAYCRSCNREFIVEEKVGESYVELLDDGLRQWHQVCDCDAGAIV